MTTVTYPDNLDLVIRRKRIRWTQVDMARALGGADGPLRRAAISEFERGQGTLPGGLTRDDYVRVLEAAERAMSSDVARRKAEEPEPLTIEEAVARLVRNTPPLTPKAIAGIRSIVQSVEKQKAKRDDS